MKIVVGAAFVGMLAGMGIAAIDYPWHTLGRPTHDDARRRAVATAALASGVPAAAPLAPAPERASSERRIAQAKPVVRPAKKRRQAPPIDLPVVSAAVPAEAATASSIDSRYERRANAECARGLKGFLCRENIRWRLCNGRWNDGSDPGATRCGVGKTEHGLSPG